MHRTIAISTLVLAPTLALAAPSGGPPRVDIEATCRVSEGEVRKLFGNDTAVTISSCLTQQKAAFDEMAKNWSTYTSADKANCVQQSYMPSYVEWLTCFEIQREIRRIRVDEAARPAAPKAGRSKRN